MIGCSAIYVHGRSLETDQSRLMRKLAKGTGNEQISDEAPEHDRLTRQDAHPLKILVTPIKRRAIYMYSCAGPACV